MKQIFSNFLNNTRINRAVFIIALFVFIIDSSYAQLSELNTRCLWILRDSLTSPEKIDSAMTYADKAGFDKVFIQVRGRGDALYNSEIVPQNPLLTPNDFDPLAHTILLGKILDIEVHIWFNTYILWSSRFEPKDPSHIYHTNKDWTEANLYGKMDWRMDLKSTRAPNWEGIYLAPTHPEVNPYLRLVIGEIIDNYDIDGIHFDYIRYQDDIYGYNPEGRKRFENIYTIDPLDIAKGIISTRFGWTQEFVDSINIAWDRFRQDAVTELIQMVWEDIITDNKEVQLSAAVKPNLPTAKDRYFQVWEYWLESGLLDFVVPMNYYSEITDFTRDIQFMKVNLAEEDLKNVIMGIATYNQDAQSAADKILIARLNGFSGVSIFSYDAHKNNLDWFSPLIDALGYPFEE